MAVQVWGGGCVWVDPHVTVVGVGAVHESSRKPWHRPTGLLSSCSQMRGMHQLLVLVVALEMERWEGLSGDTVHMANRSLCCLRIK